MPYTYHCFKRPEPSGFWTYIMMFLILLATLFLFVQHCSAEEYTNSQIANAIFVIEGGHKAQYLYGIRSVKYSNIQEARRICLNTIRNNRVRYSKYGYKQYPDYLSFLASRYCPVTGKLSRAEHRLNKFWIGNLRKQLQKGK